MQRFALALLLAAAASSACVDAPRPPLDDDRRPVDDGIVVDADGLARAELWFHGAYDVRSLGVAVRVEGADVVEWERDDALFTANGGRVIPLESKMRDNTFHLIAGTTVPANVGDDGVRLASFVLRPRAGETPRLVVVDEPTLGSVDGAGVRHALVAGADLTIRSGGAR
ncbi:MAG: hypothetical protein IT383_10040 [Deltaproteobacteria bacterium]|nr:hypothetical protein [Deltaproteobacteria bacterium]